MDLPLKVPELEAGPFHLREWNENDSPLVREAGNDPHIPLITTVPKQFTEDEWLAFLERQRDRARSGEGYSFVVADAKTDVGVGSIGLWLRNVDLGRAFLGYWVVASARGHRAATHALLAVSQFGLVDLKIPRLELWVEPWNLASIATAERSGYHREGLLRSWEEVDGKRRDMLMYARLELLVEPSSDAPALMGTANTH